MPEKFAISQTCDKLIYHYTDLNSHTKCFWRPLNVFIFLTHSFKSICTTDSSLNYLQGRVKTYILRTISMYCK